MLFPFIATALLSVGLASAASGSDRAGKEGPAGATEASENTHLGRHLFIDPRLCNESSPVGAIKPELHLAHHLAACKRSPTGRDKKRILVTGGAGFVGSHLVDDLVLSGHEVTVIDSLYTGRRRNIQHWLGHENFNFIERDIIEGNRGDEYDQIYHLASPASPVHYMADPIKTIKTITLGTMRMLNLAQKLNIRIVLASTSEIYGDAREHPQAETYWGNANPVGPRSCYDESKRLAEALAVAYRDQRNVSVGIARIFNTYGPRMHPNDGRVVSNFIAQSLSNKPITVYGKGEQTRSFQYVSDLVRGLKQLMGSNVTSPVNLGNPDEMSINSLATTIKQTLANSTSEIIYRELPEDDPVRRRPDIRKAMRLLDWRPTIKLAQGLERTIEYFVKELQQ